MARPIRVTIDFALLKRFSVLSRSASDRYANALFVCACGIGNGYTLLLPTNTYLTMFLGKETVRGVVYSCIEINRYFHAMISRLPPELRIMAIQNSDLLI